MRLLRIITKRVILGIVTLLLVSVMVFVATQGLPGDTAVAILGKDATPERLAQVREELQLDRPLVVQYGSWLGGIARVDLGNSLVAHESVAELIGQRVMNSLALVIVAALASVPLGMAIGSVSALRRDRPFDMGTTLASLVLVAMPEFVIGLLMILIFSIGLIHALPAVSDVNPDQSIWSQMDEIILPSLTLALAVLPYIVRILRGSMVDVFESDYVQLARLKGMRERIVMQRHALPNAIAPTIQVIAMNLAWLAGGVVVVEYLFNYPGIGSMLIDAVTNRDMPVVQAITLLIAAVYVILNLIADILTILVSPRLRTSLREG